MLAIKKLFSANGNNKKVPRKDGISVSRVPAGLHSRPIDAARFNKAQVFYNKPNENAAAATFSDFGKQQRTGASTDAKARRLAASVTSAGDCASSFESRPPVPPKRQAKRRPPPSRSQHPVRKTAERESFRGTFSRPNLAPPPSPPPPPPTKLLPARPHPSETCILVELLEDIADKFLGVAKSIIAQLKANNATKNQQLVEFERTIADLIAETRQKDQVAEAQRTIAELEAVLHEEAQRSSRDRQIIAQLEVQITEKTQRLAEVEQINMRLEAEHVVKTSQLIEAQNNIDVLMIEIAEKSRLLVDAREIYERVMTDVTEKDRQLDDALRTIAELRAEIAEKTQRIIEAERTIETHGVFCSICLTEVANRIWSRCYHLAACGKCAETLDKSVTGENRSQHGIACPKCRTHGRPFQAFI